MLGGTERQIQPLIHGLGNTDREWKWRKFADINAHPHAEKMKTQDPENDRAVGSNKPAT